MELATIRERILETPLVKDMPGDMSQRFVMMLLWISDTVTVSREERIYEQGDTDAHEGCLVLEGMVRIITEEQRAKTIEAPEILGEVQLFTPQGRRTATVEVVVGGQILQFSWNDLGKIMKEFYTEEEVATLKKLITKSAWTREENLSEKIKSSS